MPSLIGMSLGRDKSICPPYVKTWQLMRTEIEVPVDNDDAMVSHHKLLGDELHDRVGELSCFGPCWSTREAVDRDHCDDMMAHIMLGS